MFPWARGPQECLVPRVVADTVLHQPSAASVPGLSGQLTVALPAAPSPFHCTRFPLLFPPGFLCSPSIHAEHPSDTLALTFPGASASALLQHPSPQGSPHSKDQCVLPLCTTWSQPVCPVVPPPSFFPVATVSPCLYSHSCIWRLPPLAVVTLSSSGDAPGYPTASSTPRGQALWLEKVIESW